MKINYRCNPILKLFVFFLCTILCSTILSSCSLPKTQIIHETNEDFSSVSSFYLYPIQLGPTLAGTSEVSRKFSMLEEDIRKKLSDMGYVMQPAKNAEGLIKFTIETDTTGAASDEEIRMMKGSHQSNFPDANPRLRSLEADYLHIEISTILDNRIVYSAKCRLIEGQDALAPVGSVPLTAEQIRGCIDDLVPKK